MSSQLGCCGTQSYRDWVNTTFSLASHSVPDSCCLSDIVGCGRGILSIDAHQVFSSEIIHASLYVSLKASMKIHSQGCMAVISHHMKENVTMIVAIIVGTLFVQVLNWVVQEPDFPFNLLLQFLGLVFSFCLANSIKKECEIVWVLDLGMLSKCCPCSDSSSRTRSRKQYFVRASPGDGELVNLWN